MLLIGKQWAAALSVVVRPKSGQGSWVTTPARSLLDRQGMLDAILRL
jgi:hypothetical protein